MLNGKALSKFMLNDKLIVLTGATGILGSLYAEMLVDAGANVLIADLYEDKCMYLANKINEALNEEKAYPMPIDLSNEKNIITWAEDIVKRFGKIDCLINNAATKSKNFFAPLEEFSLDDWNFVVSVNMTGIFLASREIGKQMCKQGYGNIINISSIYGIVAPDQRIYEGSWYDDMGGQINTPLVYSATKGAVVAMTKYMATYWGDKGIRVNTLTPGGVASGQNDVFNKKYSDKVPLARMANAEEMIGALIFLVSDASSYITGQNVIVDGGWTVW